MVVESLELKDFRNYERLSLTFESGTNIIYGDNAQGKTNILEAIYLGGTTRSHRGSHDMEMIRFGCEEAHIRMTVEKDSFHHRIDMHLKKNKAKGVAIDGVPIRRAAELYGMLHLVVFSPEDLNIIKKGPGERRKFINTELCQLDSVYLSELSKYNKILQQRNKLLKDIYFQPSLESTLDVWNSQLVDCGARLIRQRDAFVDTLNRIVQKIHPSLTDGKEEIEIDYEPNVESEDFAEQLEIAREQDLRYRTTTVGPHRDDIRVNVNGVDIRQFGSQGQQRTAALSLKLSEIYLVEEQIHDRPVLLLDDVLSELDRSRQKKLLENIEDLQIFITCTGLDELVKNRFPINRVFHIENGRLSDDSPQ